MLDDGLLAYELQQSSVIRALLTYFDVTAPASHTCATPLGRQRHQNTLKEWLGSPVNSMEGASVSEPPPELLPAELAARWTQLRGALDLEHNTDKLKHLLKIIHQVVGMGEELPIYCYSHPTFDSSKQRNLRALVSPVNVELSSIEGNTLGVYQIEPLAKVETVRKLILCSAPMGGPSTAAYWEYCQRIVGCRILAKLQMRPDQAMTYREATIKSCKFVNSVPVHTIEVSSFVDEDMFLDAEESADDEADDDSSEDDVSNAESAEEQLVPAPDDVDGERPLSDPTLEAILSAANTVELVLAATKYRILEWIAVPAEPELEAEENLGEAEQSYSVKVSFASAQQQPERFSINIVKPEWYDIKEFWQAIRHELIKALVSGGFSWKDRGWEGGEKECLTCCNKQLLETAQGCVARHLIQDEANVLMEQLKNVVQCEMEPHEPAGDTPEDQAFDRASRSIARALKWADDLPGTVEREYPDRGWSNHDEMLAACVAGWKEDGQGCLARGQTLKEGETLVTLLGASGLEAELEQDSHDLCYRKRRKARSREATMPSRGQRIGVRHVDETTKPATILAADDATRVCVVVYDDGRVERGIELPRLVHSSGSRGSQFGRRSRAPNDGPAPLTRQMSVLNRYVEKIDSRGEALYVEDRAGLAPGHIHQEDDGELVHEGVFVEREPKPPEQWATAELPMELTVAYSLGNGRSQVILPTDQMTIWQALQKVEDTMKRHDPEPPEPTTRDVDPLQAVLSEEMSPDRQLQAMLRAKEQYRLTQTPRRQLKFSISANVSDDTINLEAKKYNPNLLSKPRWSPEEVVEMSESDSSSLTKKQLIEEMQSVATPQWLKQNGLKASSRNLLKKCTVPALIDKYRHLCDTPLLAPPKVHVASGELTSIDKLCDIKRESVEALLLIEALHQELCEVLPTSNHAWRDAKLCSLLAQQLDDPMSVLTGTLPDWCFVLVQNAPCVFDVELRKKLFELSAFGVSETVARIQSKLLADLISKHKKMIASEDMETMMAGVQLEEDIKYLSIGKQQEDVARAAVRLDDGPGMLDFAQKLMELTSKTHRPLSVQYEQGHGDGLTRAFFGAVAKELTSRSQNERVPMWLSDGRDTEYLTNKTLLPKLQLTQTPEVLARFRFLGRFLAKACRNKGVVPVPLDPALFAVLFDNSPRHIVQSFSVDNPESRLGYERKMLKTFKEPFSRYDILNVFFQICDEIEALDKQCTLSQNPEADHRAGLEELAKRRVSGTTGGWLATLPRAFEWFLQAHPDATTETVLAMFNEDDMVTCRNFLDLVELDQAQGLCEFGTVSVYNALEFAALLLEAIKSAIVPQLQALCSGIEDVLPLSSLEKFYPDELSELMCGKVEVDWNETQLLNEVFLFGSSEGIRYSKQQPGIRVLAAVLEEFNTEQRCQFLEFVTGASRLTPGEKLQITILPRELSLPFSRNCAPFMLSLCDYYQKALDRDPLGWEDECSFKEGTAVRNAWDSAAMAAMTCYPEPLHPAEPEPCPAEDTDAEEQDNVLSDEPAAAESSDQQDPLALQRVPSVATQVASALLERTNSQGVVPGSWSCLGQTEQIHMSITAKKVRFEEQGRGMTVCAGEIGQDGVIRGSVIQNGDDRGGVFEFTPVAESEEAEAAYKGTISFESEASQYDISINLGSNQPVESMAAGEAEASNYCPRCGKELVVFYTPRPGFTCDKCSACLSDGAQAYSCRDCDFDIGVECGCCEPRPQDVEDPQRLHYAKALLRFYFLLTFDQMVSGGYVH